MKMPFFFNKKRKVSEQIFYGLFLKEDEGSVMILRSREKKLEIIAKEKFKFSNGWENLAEDVDQTLFKLESQNKKTSNNLIIFVYSHFIDENTHEIRLPYLQKVKSLVKELELKALGFIESMEAITSYLEVKEESPLTAIVIEIDKTNLTIAVYKGGQKVLAKSIPKTDNLIEDLLSVFNTQKNKTLLPSRVILYNSKDLDDLSTKIITYHWSEDLFIQLPKVEIINEDKLTDALLQVFSEQVNSNIPTDTEPPAKKILDFAIGEDIKKEKIVNETPTKINYFKNFLNIFTPIKAVLNNIFKKKQSMKYTALIPIVIGLVLIIIGFFPLEFYLHKAEIKIYLPTQPIQKELDIKDSIGSSALKTITDTYDLKGSIIATGKQTVGEKAKGEVTIYSFNDKETRFSKGTVLTSEGIKFVLDSDVAVASSSEIMVNSSPVKKPGEVKGKVVANDIGSEGNLGKGKRFQISDYSSSSYFAMNDAAFAGGSKKELTTVSKKDLNALKDQLLNKAKTVAHQKQYSGEKQKVLNNLTEIELTDEQYSKEVGEEAKNVELKTKAKVSAYLYDEDKLREQLLSSIKNEIKEGYQLDKESLKYEIKKSEKKDNDIKLAININTKAIQKISKEDLLKDIILKDKKSLENILKNKFRVEGYDLDISSPIPILKNILPLFKRNIYLKISSLN